MCRAGAEGSLESPAATHTPQKPPVFRGFGAFSSDIQTGRVVPPSCRRFWGEPFRVPGPSILRVGSLTLSLRCCCSPSQFRDCCCLSRCCSPLLCHRIFFHCHPEPCARSAQGEGPASSFAFHASRPVKLRRRHRVTSIAACRRSRPPGNANLPIGGSLLAVSALHERENSSRGDKRRLSSRQRRRYLVAGSQKSGLLLPGPGFQAMPQSVLF